jgi:hypothetical protein
LSTGSDPDGPETRMVQKRCKSLRERTEFGLAFAEVAMRPTLMPLPMTSAQHWPSPPSGKLGFHAGEVFPTMFQGAAENGRVRCRVAAPSLNLGDLP